MGSLSLPPSTFACCVHKASRVAPTIPGSVMSEGQVCRVMVAALANRTTADDIPPQFFMLFCGSCSHACVQRCNYHILIT